MKLYGFPYSHNTRKILAVARDLKVDLPLEVVDIVAKKSYEPAYVAMNPTGLTPCLEHDGFTLWESNAILVYLCEQAGETPLWPSGSAARADVLRWMFWQNAHWNPGFDLLLIERLVKKLETGDAPDAGETARGEALLRRQEAAPTLERVLSERDFVAGADVTIADYAIASHLQYKDICSYPLADYPNICAWFDRVRARPAWRDTEPDWSALD